MIMTAIKSTIGFEKYNTEVRQFLQDCYKLVAVQSTSNAKR